jgi:hypothetical protein
LKRVGIVDIALDDFHVVRKTAGQTL